MPALFAVVRAFGPAWDRARPMEVQPGWDAHARFMDGLAADGFVVAGGPLAGTEEVLLIVRARDRAAVEARLAADPPARPKPRRFGVAKARGVKTCCASSASRNGPCASGRWTAPAAPKTIGI